MDLQLHKAALMGDVDSLTRLLEEDALILARSAAVGETPLHVAALFGHVEFAQAILSRNPELASVLDSERLSPLHLASAKGHVEMVKELLKTNPNMCLVRDKDGRTPLHAAVLKGRVEVVKVLVGENRIVTRVLTGCREPILHFCVNHDQFQIVRALLECVDNDEEVEFMNMKDDDDNTILHLAADKKHIPLTELLLRKTKMRAEVNALNVHGFTALDVLLQKNCSKSKDMKLEAILRRAGAESVDAMHHMRDDWTFQPLSLQKNRWKKHADWLNETRNALMVVAVLISTITFQAGINPPGGLWQDDSPDQEDWKARSHSAGESIMAYYYPLNYALYAIFNAMAFVASLIIILLLISGFSLKKPIFMWALMVITWIASSSMIVTYALAFLTSSTGATFPYYSPLIAILSWLVLIGLLFAAHFFRFIIWLARKVNALIYIQRNKLPSMDAIVQQRWSRMEHV